MHSNSHPGTARFCALFVSLVLIAGTAMAGDVVSTGNGDWDDGGTWGGTAPTAADDVFVAANHTVTINGIGTTNINSLSVSGILEHAQNSSEPAIDKIVLSITNNCTIATGGEINVMGKGFAVDQGPGAPTDGYAGGSHGGIGSRYNSFANSLGPTYGSFNSPTNLGSGGAESGGDGGGAVRLDVGGLCTVDGTINADGKPGNTYAGGAGGSVYITCATFAGSGTISADGEYNTSRADTGGGGGGRIAVVLTNGSSFGSVTMTAYAGTAGYHNLPSAGTIFTRTLSQTYGTLKVDNNGLGSHGGAIVDGGLMNQATEIPIGATWQLDTIAVTNGGNLWVPTNTTLIVSDFAASHTSGYLTVEGTLSVPGDLVVTNITLMPLVGSSFPGLTNLTVAAGGIISHVDNTTDEDYRLEITVPGNLTINAGGMINVDGKGYWRSLGPAGGGSYSMGGGHGGQGGSGRDTGQDPRACYGSITSPTNIGSAGQRHTGPSETDGGGAAKITVGETTTLNGLMTANGKTTANNLAGAGAGGSVWLTTSNLVGAGTVRANGGDATVSAGSGGGGGRIAVYLTGSDDFGSVAFQTFGGDGSVYSTRDPDGAAGTIYRQTQSQAAGRGELIIDNNGLVTTRGERTQVNTNVTDTVVGDVIIRNAGHLEVVDNLSITVYGIWSNGYDFVAGAGGTVELAGTNTVTVFGSNTFDTLVCTGVTKQINFEAGETTGVAGAFTFVGPSDTSLVLRSTSPPTQWILDLYESASVNIEYVDVQYSDARPGKKATALTSIDSGSNSNWEFTVAGQTNIWIGSSSTDWAENGNWSLNRAPIEQDAMVIISNGTYDPLMPLEQTFNNLDVWASATLYLNTNNLTVNGATVIAGTVIGGGSETITFSSNLTVSGTLTAAGTEAIYLGGDVDFSSGTVNPAMSHAYINGTTAQSITSAEESFYSLTASNLSALVTFADAAQATYYYSRSGNVTYGGDFAATQFRVYSDNGAVTQTFNTGSTYAFQELWLQGAFGKTQHLESAGAWALNVSGMVHVKHVKAAYSDASGGNPIFAFNSTDNGNNVNWDFTGPFAVWTGGSGSTFGTAGSWDPPGVPDATTCILVDTNVTLTVSSAATVKYALIGGDNVTAMEINSAFTVVSNLAVINNGTLEINDDPGLTVGNDMYVAAGATLTHEDNSTAEDDRMVVTVGDDFTIESGGKIDVTGLGYDNGYGPGLPTQSYSGGSYGGKGGVRYAGTGTRAMAGPTYGSLKAPTNLGSGGSDDGSAHGGGAVQLTVGGTTTVNGEILAVGWDGVSFDSGSGGSVYITTGDFGGSGTISVNGGFGSTGDHGSGGGGRISVVLTNGSSFGSVTMTAHAGGLRISNMAIAARMADAMGDREFAEQCRQWLRQGQESMENKMWN
ncbi:MAG: hypothetical protein HQ559_16655, partial [Lentisphaerae bacterium]|nr:hypothetical protein [Lentisphaerota bacterium]